MPFQFTCPTCHESFSGRDRTRVYCSRQCAAKGLVIVGVRQVLCVQCGTPFTTRGTRERYCCSRACAAARIRVHGMKGTPEWKTWMGMKQRCFNPTSHRYPDYGARGITVCDRWLHDFGAFYSDMGPRPTAKHSIDRINNDGNYEPGNCRWATTVEQRANRRPIKRKRDATATARS
jgi:hypothetical protein